MAAENSEIKYLFRGNSNYRDGPIGKALDMDADEADIQNPADHVLRKQSRLSSRYASFTTEVAIARSFTSAPDNRYIRKVDLKELRKLESNGRICLLDADRVYNELLMSDKKKLVRQAADVRAAMKRNNEVLIEGQIPPRHH